MITDRTEARRRALRAAQLVTLSLGLATGCGAATQPPIGDGAVADFGSDAGRDASGDAGPVCSAPGAPCGPADNLCNPMCGFTYDPDCCACHAPTGCAVTGPFVPPAMA